MQVITILLNVKIRDCPTEPLSHERPLLECGVECIVGVTKAFPSRVRDYSVVAACDVGRSFHEDGRETGLEMHILDRVSFRTRIEQRKSSNQYGSGGTKGLDCLR